MFEIVGSVDRQQFRIAVRHEAMAAAFEFAQPAAHRPPTPAPVEDGRVADYVLDMLHRGVSAGVVLVVGPGTSYPGQIDSLAV